MENRDAIPHSRNDALESGEQHRCSEVDSLIWLSDVACGCLAGTQECKKRSLQVQLHQACHC
jgi:hypothetical protein